MPWFLNEKCTVAGRFYAPTHFKCWRKNNANVSEHLLVIKDQRQRSTKRPKRSELSMATLLWRLRRPMCRIIANGLNTQNDETIRQRRRKKNRRVMSRWDGFEMGERAQSIWSTLSFRLMEKEGKTIFPNVTIATECDRSWLYNKFSLNSDRRMLEISFVINKMSFFSKAASCCRGKKWSTEILLSNKRGREIIETYKSARRRWFHYFSDRSSGTASLIRLIAIGQYRSINEIQLTDFFSIAGQKYKVVSKQCYFWICFINGIYGLETVNWSYRLLQCGGYEGRSSNRAIEWFQETFQTGSIGLPLCFVIVFYFDGKKLIS